MYHKYVFTSIWSFGSETKFWLVHRSFSVRVPAQLSPPKPNISVCGNVFLIQPPRKRNVEQLRRAHTQISYDPIKTSLQFVSNILYLCKPTCILVNDVLGFFRFGGVLFWYGWPIRRAIGKAETEYIANINCWRFLFFWWLRQCQIISLKMF